MNLVTGGTGLIGAHLLHGLIRSGENVRAIYRRKDSIQNTRRIFSFYPDSSGLFEKIQWVEGDIRDIHSLLEAMDGVKHVYHCAGMVSFHPSREKQLRKTNIEGTSNLVNAALEKKAGKLCHASSVAAFGEWPDHTVITEDTFWKGAARSNYYAQTKYAAEREVWRGIEEGLNAVIVNPAVVLGPGDWNSSSSRIFSKAWEGIRYYPPGSSGYVDVRDVVSIMMKLMNSDISRERFILVSETMPIRQFTGLLNEALGKKAPDRAAGKTFLRFLSRADRLKAFLTGGQPQLTETIVNAITKTTAFSNEKIRKRLGYNFINVKESLAWNAGIFLSEINASRSALPNARG